jgi:hypothetical protein
LTYKKEPHINARKVANIKYPNGAYLELDIWIPNYNLGFEFQVTSSSSPYPPSSFPKYQDYSKYNRV